MNCPQKVRHFLGIFMNRKISTEIRLQVLRFLEQGLRSTAIASRLQLLRCTVQQWQYAFDRGDLGWLDPAYRASADSGRALEAVRAFEILGSYSAAGRACGLRPSDVFRYVKNMAKYGIPLLPRGRSSAPMRMDMKSRSRTKSLISTKKTENAQIGGTPDRAAADHDRKSSRIDGQASWRRKRRSKKISSLTQQLRQHIAEGYPLPSLVDSPAPTGAPFIVVLEHLANECLKIRLSANASEHCTSSTKADTASGE